LQLEAFRSVQDDTFGKCLERGLRKSSRNVTGTNVARLRFELPLPQIGAGDLRAYAVELRKKYTGDGSEYPVHADVIAMRIGRALVLQQFVFIEARTPERTWFEEAAVGRAAARAFDPNEYPGLLARLAASLRASRAAVNVRAAAGKERARALLFRLSDFPALYRASDSNVNDPVDDCLDQSGITLVGRASSPLFEVRKHPESSLSAVSTSFVLSTSRQAEEALRSVDRRSFGDCVVSTLRDPWQSEHVTRTSVEKLEFGTYAGVPPGDARAYAVELRVEIGDTGVETTTHMDVIAMRIGRALVLDEFCFLESRTPALAPVEEAAVGKAVVRAIARSS